MNKLASAAVFLIAILALSGCSGADKSPAQPSESGAVRISVFAQQDPSQNIASSDFSLLLEEKFGVAFDWDIVSSADGAKEKRQISLASGKYDDAYILTSYVDQFSQADLVRYGKEGVFYPLNDLIDEYAPNIKAAFEKDPVLKTMNTAPDGNIYGLIAYSDCFHCSYPNKMWLNEKWLKQLGLSLPGTTEQFRDVLRAFKTQDPNGNGLADEIPLSGSTEDFGVRVIPYLMNGFVYDDDRTYLRLAGGKASLVAGTPEWREGLTYVKSLYDEGLLDPGAFTQNSDAYKKIGENPEVQILGAGTAMHPDIFVDTGPGNGRGSDYSPLPPLQGPHADYAVYYRAGIAPGAKFVITDKASPEARVALIRMVDYMYTPEGQANAEVGMEGVDWRKPAEGEKALGPDAAPKFARIPLNKDEPPRNSGWGGMGHFYMPRDYRDSWVQGTDIYAPDGYERRLYEATLLYEGKEPKEPYPLWDVWIDLAEADEASVLQTNIKNYIDQYALQFITGDKDLNKDWEDYVEGLTRLGVDKYVEIMQKAYDSRAQ